MSSPITQSAPVLLAHHEGESLYSAPEATLKGLLESGTPLVRVFGPEDDRFRALFRLGRAEVIADLLRRHAIAMRSTPSAARGLALAEYEARAGRSALALVPNVELDDAASALARACQPLPVGSALVALLEDDPRGSSHRCPQERVDRLGMPCLVPSDLDDLRDAMEVAARLSRAGRRAAAVIVHQSVLNATQTIVSRPNRLAADVDAMLARRRRPVPRVEGTEVLRLARRLELNRTSGLPSPGERVPIGFIAVGPALGSLRYLAHVLRLAERVPIMQLGLTAPIDGTALARLLGRCDQVVVVELRPGTIEARVRGVAGAMRQRGESPGTVWGRTLPPDADGASPVVGDDEALHPSRLARRIIHLLHDVRPAGPIHAQLVGAPPSADVDLPPRGWTIGLSAALAMVRQLAADTDQWVREQRDELEADEEIEFVPTALAIDGALHGEAGAGTVYVETWGPNRFRREGIAALRDAARDDRPWILLICDVDNEDRSDLERLARGVVPEEGAGRVAIERGNLADTAGLGEQLRAACRRNRVTVIIVADGPPVQCDLAATEQAFAEIDRLGYEPRQRETWPADRICAVRPNRRADPTEARAARENTAMRSALRFDRVASRPGVRVRYRVRPLLQRADVIRSRPPKRRWRRESDRPLATPEVVHRSAPLWRAHLAGFRSGGAGLAATVLCQAGRLMGYAVSAQHDPSPIGAGRRAWTEILFTHPRAAEPAPPLTARTPFGEADLIVGLDAAETLRAITADPELCVASADRTFAVVNDGFFVDERRTEVAGELREQLRTLLRETTRAQPRIVEDFADACRARLHTDRVADLVLLGAAFQVGLVPVHAGAIEAAVAEAEAAGYGRAGEAFRFGRTLADDQRAFRRLRDEREDEGDRMIRRLQHGVGRRRGRRRREAERLRDLLRRSLEAMPGLSESDPGRQARRDFAASLYRCTVWAGTDYAERYANRIVDLYRADRGDTGRALVRNAILPLAAAMLIRDLVYVASMSVSGEQTREIRQKLNVKRARSDELERRFLTRFELVFYGYRLRADLRTSDWPAQLLAWGRGVVPRAWRGTRRERALRRDLERLIDDARRHASDRYEYYHDALVRLNRQAEDHALRGMAVSELRMLVDPEAVKTVPST